ncbi:MAG: xanthine dehydrogenase family protein molybdopterin-binding subunit [Desulfobacterota bacterium]|nr:xanthine dehydrogenase family protein molybdopterin-binding subunit [Thermodesulfobacteriota bacterium]MDW8002343.1 xanthine dehydrogenase family protein molybdopterin-binding subunit [Deltaproteobacteria bacterium]
METIIIGDYDLLGKSIPRVDGREKVTGAAKYAADIELAGMLWCKILRSPLPHAKILNIDVSKAKRVIGVKAICTAKDFGGFRWGWMPATRDEPPLAEDKVRYYGEGVAAVAAIDEDTAEEALEQIKVDYEELPAVFDAEEALKEGAPVIHDYRPNNISWEFHMDFGDVDRAFREADLVREDRFVTARVIQGFLEPPSAVAYWEGGGVTIYAAKQSPYFLYRHIAQCFKLPLSKVRVIQPFVGGGFGGTKNDSVAGDFCVVMLSKMTGKPVKFVYSMEEVMVTSRRRHNCVIYNKMGMKKDGTIVAMQSKVIADGGAYTAIGPLTMYLTGCLSTLPYKLPNFRHDAYRVFTNNPVSAAMRGHGVTHTRFAAEIQMEMMAEELGLDPIEVRLKNAIEAPYETVNKITVHSCGLKEGLMRLKESSLWKEKEKEKRKNHILCGVGVSGTAYLGGARQRGHQSAGAILRLCEDGTVEYLTGATDAGQGSDTVLVQIIAEELGLPIEHIDIKRVDTAYTPIDPGTYGSRVTALAGEAAMKAARDLKRQLAEIAAKEWNVTPDEIVFKNGTVSVKDQPLKSLPFRKLAQIACYSGSGRVLIGKGYSEYGIEPLDFEKGIGNAGTAYSFTAQLSRVEVDSETGFVKCTDMIIAHDCGKPLNPALVESQNQGAAVQGLGQALYEEFKMDKGRTLNPNFADYKIPGIKDVPKIEVIHVLTEDPNVPYGAKEASEGAIVSTPPSIVSAIHDATGIWFTELPVTPEKIALALRNRK